MMKLKRDLLKWWKFQNKLLKELGYEESSIGRLIPNSR